MKTLTNEEYNAIKDFAEKLKQDFPAKIDPMNFNERMVNLFNEYARKKIDWALEDVKQGLELCALDMEKST